MNVVGLLVGVLVVALVWILTGALRLPYTVSLIVTILAAIWLLGPYAGRWGPR